MNEVASRLGGRNGSKTFYTVDMETTVSSPHALVPHSSPRCSMFMVLADNAKKLEEFLNVSGSNGLFRKDRKHLFITSDSGVKDVVYSMEEFQFHGHTG